MADEPDNIVLRYLRRIDEKLDLVRDDVRELKTTQAGMLQILASHEGRLQKIETRLERIERRLDLIDAPA
jgi:hypothetical protein